MFVSHCREPAVLLMALFLALDSCPAAERLFRAGASAVDITPVKFPVIVNAMFEERSADRANDRLHARSLALDDGSTRLVICVVDTCMMPRDFLDAAKALAGKETGILPERILISATHTHSAPSAMGCLGSRPDEEYQKFLAPKIAESIALAARKLRPARIGWASVDDFDHTFCRRWIRRPDRMLDDPFGKKNVRANMHPGHESPDVIGPSGPVDPGLSVVSLQTLDGRPLALLANYSMHYYESPLLSADYYGAFARLIGTRLGAGTRPGDPVFVGIMSQGTSGDLMWMDYAKPARKIGFEAYAAELVEKALEAHRKIEHREWVPLEMREGLLALRFRTADAERLAWAKSVAERTGDRQPRGYAEIYAREALFLAARPTAELKLQAIRIGDLGIAAIPNEVYGITGLKIKTQSPLATNFVMSLANGAEGYIPPPEQHRLGGYTTWPARTAGLEVEAEPRIVEGVLALLENASGRPRRAPSEIHGAYAKAVLEAAPAAYYRLGELEGAPLDSSGRGAHGSYSGNIAYHLDGPASPALSGETLSGETPSRQANPNRCVHLAGGILRAGAPSPGGALTVELWFWNGLPADARETTGVLLSSDAAGDAPAFSLAIGGKSGSPGRLVCRTGLPDKPPLAGKSEIPPRTWHHLALVRVGRAVCVFLDGRRDPEISGEAPAVPSGLTMSIGGGAEGDSSLEGKIDEVAIYDRALGPDEVARRFQLTGQAARPARQ